MTPSRKLSATKALLLPWLACLGMQALAAQVAGTVTQLSGPLMVKKPDGQVKILALKSEVESGDTLVTEKNTYALVKFIDNSEITLKPSTTLVVEQFTFEAGQPEADRASFSLVKGGLRALSGLLGKRNKEKFALKTPVATIGIHGTYFIATYVGPTAPAPTMPVAPARPSAPGSAALPAPGLYVQVLDGEVFLKNGGGTQSFTAGQFGYTPNFVAPPVLIPVNPGITFSPPRFTSTQASPADTASADKGAVNCIVR